MFRCIYNYIFINIDYRSRNLFSNEIKRINMLRNNNIASCYEDTIIPRDKNHKC